MKMNPGLRALLCLALLSGAAVARAQGSSPPDSGGFIPPIPHSWYLEPAVPCQSDSITFVVVGYEATPCDSFVSATQVDGEHFRVRTQMYRDRACFAAPFKFYPIRFPLGPRSAGSHRIYIDVETRYVDASGYDSVGVRHETFDYFVSAQCPGPQPGRLPFVTSISIAPSPPCPERLTQLVLEGDFRSGCGKVLSANVIDPEHVRITIQTDSPPAPLCTAVFQHWRQEFNLGYLGSGPHVVKILETVVDQFGASDTTNTDPGTLVGTYEATHAFGVAPACDPVIYPQIPTVDRIAVLGGGPCDSFPSPACPGESISVSFSGRTWDSCTTLKRIQLLPSPIAGPGPQPPVVQLEFGAACCMCDIACFQGEHHWYGQVTLPPLPRGGYGLIVNIATGACAESLTVVGFANAPIVVSDSCHFTSPACLLGSFQHSSPDFGCDATVAPGRPAGLTLNVRTAVALSGLEGRFQVYPNGLHITGVEPVGAAAGMHLNWNATDDGAHFVMFAEHGAPIPATPESQEGGPVLRVILSQTGRGLLPRVSFVVPNDLLGSDINGNAVHECVPPPCVKTFADPRLFLTGRVCTQIPCDFNADGRTDVRDLVTMVHCVNGEGPCPDSVSGRYDCDNSGHFDLEDVLCCALDLLSGDDCENCPVPGDSGQSRPEPTVKMEFGSPTGTSTGIELPLLVRGSSRVGAAALTLNFPGDRYDVLGVEVSDPARWLRLFQAQGGKLKIGLIRLGNNAPGGGIPGNEVSLKLKLALRSGSQAGGQITTAATQFSGPDGVALVVDLGQPVGELYAAPRLVLSGPKPNPFSTTVRFSLTLEQSAPVEVEVFDIHGRKVAALWNGLVQAGTRDFTWDGRTQGGTLASGGVYFYRATSQGVAVSRKMALLRRN